MTLRNVAVLSTALIGAAGCWGDDLRPFAPSPSAAELALEDGLGVQLGHDHALEVQWDLKERFDQLVLDSDLIVRGTVESRRPGWTPLDRKGVPVRDLPLVVSTVRIRTVLRAGERASAAAEGGTIEIVEAGGRLEDGCFAEPDDKPVLKRGEDAVFFLSRAGRSGPYQVVGGWQGRLWVLGKRIRSLAADVHPSDPAATAHDGETVEALIVTVARAPSRESRL